MHFVPFVRRGEKFFGCNLTKNEKFSFERKKYVDCGAKVSFDEFEKCLDVDDQLLGVRLFKSRRNNCFSDFINE